MIITIIESNYQSGIKTAGLVLRRKYWARLTQAFKPHVVPVNLFCQNRDRQAGQRLMRVKSALGCAISQTAKTSDIGSGLSIVNNLFILSGGSPKRLIFTDSSLIRVFSREFDIIRLE